MKGKRTPDFSGWATKYGIQCADGRTILPGAFKDMDGKKVPIVWGHIHDDPDMVLGHAYLFSKPEGIWTEGYFNNNPKAQSTKETLRNEDVDGLSIYANELKHVNGRQVQHGNIRELSVVLAGANKGATIENVLLAHGDLLDELDDECIVYNDDEPLFHDEDSAKLRKKKTVPDDDDEDEEEDGEEDEDEEEEGEDDEEDEEDEDLQHSDDDVSDLQEIWDSMTEEQQDLCSYLVEQAENGGEIQHSAEESAEMKEIWESMNEDQQNLCAYLVGEAEGGEDDEEDDDDSEGGDEDDAAEHSDHEEETDMKNNVFDRTRSIHPDDVLSHEDQKAIIERGRALGSMREAWKEALQTNDALKHDVFNDDGTKQTYGVANIDYLFPDYTELNSTPDMIRRDDAWVGVILEGVSKTPHSRLKTTVANITMEEARAKGYTKGDKKDPEVFNLLHRTVDPQTIYKYQEMDQDDVIDVDEFDVIAWIKAEMRIMLNEEIARAILLGDGRLYNDKYKIKEDHIKPIATDDDLYAIKVTCKAGTDQDPDVAKAQTAKNAIRAMIKNRKFYKGSGNLVWFTSEDWLSEMLLLEDGFGHELYEDATKLAKKLRTNRIVTCPFMEDLTIDGQQVVGIAVDLKDYRTGTNRRGKITFFDDFDIQFNKNQYLLETRLSGMLAKPFSAMIVKVGTGSYAGPHYDEVTPVGSENPRNEGWYEKEGAIYRKSADKTVDETKTYYARSIAVAQAGNGGSNP